MLWLLSASLEAHGVLPVEGESSHLAVVGRDSAVPSFRVAAAGSGPPTFPIQFPTPHVGSSHPLPNARLLLLYPLIGDCD